MENSSSVRVVTLKELWEIFIRRLWVMLLIAVLCAGGFYAIIQLTFVPRYQSTATLYILNQNTTQDSSVSEDFSLALKVVNDCDYLLKSHSVLDEVIDELGLDISYEDLSECISTSNPEDTRILEVSVEADSPEEAKRIVDKVCRTGTESITAAMGFQQVNLYEYGTLDDVPCNRTSLTTYAMVGLIAAVLTYTVFLILFLVDDTIKTDEDIERYLGLTNLGDIPATGDSGKKHYGNGYSYGYGYGQKAKQSAKGGRTNGKHSSKASGR